MSSPLTHPAYTHIQTHHHFDVYVSILALDNIFLFGASGTRIPPGPQPPHLVSLPSSAQTSDIHTYTPALYGGPEKASDRVDSERTKRSFTENIWTSNGRLSQIRKAARIRKIWFQNEKMWRKRLNEREWRGFELDSVAWRRRRQKKRVDSSPPCLVIDSAIACFKEWKRSEEGKQKREAAQTKPELSRDSSSRVSF